jgi:anti-anti-sigma factor
MRAMRHKRRSESFSYAWLEDSPGVWFLLLQGELDAGSSGRLRELLEGDVPKLANGGRYAILDLRRLAYLDAEALYVLRNAAEGFKSSGGWLALVLERGSWVDRLITICGFGRHFRTFASVVAAAEGLR